GEVLDTLSDKIGEMVITQVREKISTGAYTGSTPAKVGDMVRK
ncbi:MAG: curli production assembly protein CsgG, partial [Acidobacteria bacterium]|nr:curli production assembly protein CsgG [Acidobacteriota bacterium]